MTASAPDNRLISGRELELDGLRGIAVGLVIFYHSAWIPGGRIGVDAFFVLSGFLITRLLMGTNASFLTFFGRRARRLLPALLLLCAAYLLWPWPIPDDAPSRPREVFFALSYTMDWKQAVHRVDTPLSHTWSLAVEAQFYLIWPIVVRLLPRTLAPFILAATWGALTSIRFMAPENFGYFGLHETGLLVGAAIAYIRVPPHFGTIALFALIFESFLPDHGLLGQSAIVAAEISAALIILDPPRLLRFRPIVWLGTISYGVYLWHIPIWHVLNYRGGATGTALLVGAAIAIATLSYFTVERLSRVRRKVSAPSPAS